MKKYRRKQDIITVYEWNKAGDCSDYIGEYRQGQKGEGEKDNKEMFCHRCGKKWKEHGTIKVEFEKNLFFTVCPGSCIVVDIFGQVYPMEQESLDKLYEEIEE